MHVAIEAVGTESRGGAAVLGQLLDACGSHPGVDRITVFGDPNLSLSPRRGMTFKEVVAIGSAAKLDWAVRGWGRARVESGADVALSFNGFAQAPEQYVFVHNALLFDPNVYRLSWGLRQRIRALRRLAIYASQEARGVCVQTHAMKAYVEAATGVVPVVFTPRRSPAFSGVPGHFGEQGPRLLFVGSEVPHKDSQTFIAALSLLKPATDALLVGNFGDLQDPPYGRWLGNVSTQMLGSFYRDADVLVHTSMCESLGLPLLEAMASGVPIVAADREFSREVCGEAALFFTPTDPVSCAEAVRHALEPCVRARLRALGVERHNQIGSGAYQNWVNWMLDL